MIESQIKHKETGVLYTVINTGKMKVNGEWLNCVIYQNETGIYVRETGEILENFVYEE